MIYIKKKTKSSAAFLRELVSAYSRVAGVYTERAPRVKRSFVRIGARGRNDDPRAGSAQRPVPVAFKINSGGGGGGGGGMGGGQDGRAGG